MGQGSHNPICLEPNMNDSAMRAAIKSRNYKHYAAKFPTNTTPHDLEGDMDDALSVWGFATCPYRPPCEVCGRYECHTDCFVVATDGVCSGNGTADARAAISVFFGPDNVHNFAGTLDYDCQPTSQKAELCAAIKAMEIFRSIRDTEPAMKSVDSTSLIIKSDSEYLVSSMTEYIHKWKQNKFRTAKGQPVKNKELFIQLDKLVEELTDDNRNVSFWHVPREYNKQADKMVKAALNADLPRPKVYIVGSHPLQSLLFKTAYKDLFELIQARAEVAFIRDAESLKYLAVGPETRFSLVDDGLLDPSERFDMIKFANVVRQRGSRVLLGALLPCLEIDAFLEEVFGLPWHHGNCTGNYLKLNRSNRSSSKEGLMENEYVEAIFLKGVPASDSLYQTKHIGETYAACAKYGRGYVGYIGDIRWGPLFDRAVLAMLGLPLVYDKRSYCLMTGATKMALGYGDAWLDHDQVDF